MRRVCLALFVALAAIVATEQPSSAQNRRWCTERSVFSWGFPDCSYDTFEQCRASASGTGRYCTANPWYGSADSKAQRKPKASGRKTRRQ
jgi:Protein of unknown function (DUF3551)